MNFALSSPEGRRQQRFGRSVHLWSVPPSRGKFDMTQSILKGIAVGALALAAVAAAAPSAMAQDGKQIRIGAIVPSSGPFAEWGRTNTV
ncbi:hypothetical protein, partial [Microbaculum marinum]